MLTHAQRTLQDGLWKARRLNFEFVTEPRLFVDEGYWIADVNKPLECHPLEAVLLGEEATGSWREDIGRMLGVDQSWISGFEDGFAGRRPCPKTEPEYETGFRDGITAMERLDQTAFVFGIEPR